MSGVSTASKLAAARRRIAELEAGLAEATQRIADLEATCRTLHEMHQAQKQEPPKRDPASTTTCGTTIRNTPSHGPAAVTAPGFGFGKPGYVGGATLDEGYRDEKWRDAQA